MRFHGDSKRGRWPPLHWCFGLLFLLLCFMKNLKAKELLSSPLRPHDAVASFVKNKNLTMVQKVPESLHKSSFSSRGSILTLYDEDLRENPDCRPLNLSQFHFSRWRPHSHVPRFMMEFFSEDARTLPSGATSVRSFPSRSIRGNYEIK